MNDDIYVEVKYDKDIEKSQINSIILFDYDVIGSESFHFN